METTVEDNIDKIFPCIVHQKLDLILGLDVKAGVSAYIISAREIIPKILNCVPKGNKPKISFFFSRRSLHTLFFPFHYSAEPSKTSPAECMIEPFNQVI